MELERGEGRLLVDGDGIKMAAARERARGNPCDREIKIQQCKNCERNIDERRFKTKKRAT